MIKAVWGNQSGMKRWMIAGVVAVAGVLMGTPASAQPSQQDTTYLAAAHQGNLAEIAAGRLAQQKGTAPVVNELGARLVADHSRLDEAVRAVAQQLGVALPAEPNEEQKAVAAQLQAAQAGPQFDKLWISTQIEAHETSLSAAQAEIANGSDTAVKEAAADAAAVIASHLEALATAASQMGTPTGVDAGDGGAADAPRRDLSPATATAAALLIAVGLMLRRRPGMVRR